MQEIYPEIIIEWVHGLFTMPVKIPNVFYQLPEKKNQN